MALCRRLIFPTPNFLWSFLICKLPKQFYHDGKGDTLEIDALDDFTTQLVQRKAEKWIIYQEKKRISENKHFLQSMSTVINIEYLETQDIDSLLRDAGDASDFKTIQEIFQQCEKFQKLPSLNFILRTLSYLAQKGDKDMIILIRNVCKTVDPSILEVNSNFEYFLAEAVWVKGNVTESINLFENVYRKNVYLRRRIRLVLKYLIHDGVSNRSEANLFKLVKFSERLAEDYNDYYPMVLVWENCILSEWFSDQCIALDLLKKYGGLCNAITDILSFTVMTSLHKNQAEVVYRLLEVFLAEEKKIQSFRIIITLFDYKIREGDLRGCSEIIQWSLDNDISLPAIQHEKFISLLLKRNAGVNIKPISKSKNDSPKPPFSLQF